MRTESETIVTLQDDDKIVIRHEDYPTMRLHVQRSPNSSGGCVSIEGDGVDLVTESDPDERITEHHGESIFHFHPFNR